VAARVAELVPEARVAVAHGQMNEHELEKIMVDFWDRGFDVLVATTIVESGLDIPNANTLVVDRADVAGLSQLHQLRGRVGRGEWKSYCILLTSGRLTEEAQRRVDAMTSTNDGFRIAEVDLELRGPGEFFGTRQSGLPEFRAVDLLRDTSLLEEARREASAITARDRELSDPSHRPLRAALLARWRGKLALATAG
jgi:ATP-dependent DNA helicase RecG